MEYYLPPNFKFVNRFCFQTVTVSLENVSDHIADAICKELGYDHAVDWFGVEILFFIEAW